jgi:N-acetylglucosamine-6-phosphate deacetylase
MKRSDAENYRMTRSNNHEAMNCTSLIQQAETLEEINQKTLTIRDRFAIAAMQGLLAGSLVEMDEQLNAERAYIMADAMLEARKK